MLPGSREPDHVRGSTFVLSSLQRGVSVHREEHEQVEGYTCGDLLSCPQGLFSAFEGIGWRMPQPKSVAFRTPRSTIRWM